jgi:hypothetical protein
MTAPGSAEVPGTEDRLNGRRQGTFVIGPHEGNPERGVQRVGVGVVDAQPEVVAASSRHVKRAVGVDHDEDEAGEVDSVGERSKASEQITASSTLTA